MRVTFCIPGPLRAFSGGWDEIEIETPAATLQGALEALWAAHPGLRDRMANEQGAIREHVNVFLGNEDVRYLGGLATPISSGARISVVAAISGGSQRQQPRVDTVCAVVNTGGR